MSNTTLKLEGRAWSTFLDVELAPRTKSLYSRWTQIFMQHCKVKPPDKLLGLGTVHQIEDRVIGWLGTLKDSGKATATMKTALACVVFFYSCNRVKIDSKYIARRIPKRPTLPHRSPTKEEIVAIVEAANLRSKALVSNATAANVYRLLGSIEKASVSLLIDEANSLEDDVFLMEVLKTGYKQNGMVPRIMDASSSTAEQVFYHTYCFKVIAAERLPIEYKAEGLLSRCFTIKTYPAEPKYKIDKVAEPGGDPLLVSLNSQLQKLRKLLFAYRLIHYDDPIHDVKLNIDGRDEELCSGLVRLFQRSKVLETVFTTLYEFVKEKRQNKTDSLEQKILVITKEIIDSKPEGADKYSLEFATIWNTLKDILKGKDVEGKPQSMTTAYGTLSFRVLTQMLIKFGAKRDKDANGARVLRFDETRLNNFSGLYDIPEMLKIKTVDTSGTSGTLWEDIEEYRGEKSIDSNAKVANIQEKNEQFTKEVVT